MIHLSPAATQEVLRLKAKQKNPNLFFRLGLQRGGCCDWSYTMTFEEALQSNDVLYQCGEIQVVVDTESLGYLENLTIDYSEDLMGGGFRLLNPNAERTCSCGNSFIANN